MATTVKLSNPMEARSVKSALELCGEFLKDTPKGFNLPRRSRVSRNVTMDDNPYSGTRVHYETRQANGFDLDEMESRLCQFKAEALA